MKVGLQVPDVKADLSGYTGRKDNTMKTWYLADYKDENGNIIQLLLCATEKNRQRNTSRSMRYQPSASLPRTRSTTFAARAVRLWSFERAVQSRTSSPTSEDNAVLTA